MSDGPGPFENVYDAHVLGIYRFIYARVGNHPDAEDLTAQVFVRAVELLDLQRDPRQIAAWLYRVAQNATADYWRAFYRLPLVGTDHVAPGREPADDPARHTSSTGERATARVEALMRRLGGTVRALVIGLHAHGMPGWPSDRIGRTSAARATGRASTWRDALPTAASRGGRPARIAGTLRPIPSSSPISCARGSTWRTASSTSGRPRPDAVPR